MAQLEADEKFFEDTKQACQTKATEWSVRTRLRTEELNGMQVAIKILSSPDAKKTFGADCNLRQGAGGVKFARNGSRTCFLR